MPRWQEARWNRTTFGPTRPGIDRLCGIGYEGWLQKQFIAAKSDYPACLNERAIERTLDYFWIGATRQILLCSQGGCDNHSGPLPARENLLNVLSPAITAFYRVTEELGVAESVTAFTASEFGRTMYASSTFGSDHKWGNHHFVLGGAVRGGERFGRFPSLELEGPDDAGERGVWIPTTSFDQYEASLASWFGVGAEGLAQGFPNLANFGSAGVAGLLAA